MKQIDHTIHGLVSDAIEMANKAHYGQNRKGTKLPYMVHCMDAGAIAATMTEEPDIIAAAILHDVLEDTMITAQQVKDKFGPYVYKLIKSASEDRPDGKATAANWQKRKEETLAKIPTLSREEQMVILADKLSNARSLYVDWKKLPTAVFNRFNVKDPAMHRWYYVGLLKALDKVRDTEAYMEFRRCVLDVFDVSLAEAHVGGAPWCTRQAICEEDVAEGTFTCLARANEGMFFTCPYASAEDSQDQPYPCEHYEARNQKEE